VARFDARNELRLTGPASQTIRIPYNFWWRSYQKRVIAAMDGGCRRAITVWHRRAGKDTTWLNIMIKKMFQRPGIYYYFFPKFAQGRKIMWDGKDFHGRPFLDYFPDPLVDDRNETEMQITVNVGGGKTSIFQIIGTDNYDYIVGTNPVGCVFSEYAIQDPGAWDLVRPILMENGGWAGFAYTPRGKNHGYKLFEMAKDNPNWFAEILTIDQTRRDAVREDGTPLPGENGASIVTADDIAEERASGMSDELIAQEYYCSFEGPREGSYYGELMKVVESEGRICNIPYDPRYPVYTAWDLGASDNMAIGFVQFVRAEIRFIDFDMGSGKGLPHYVRLVKEGRPYIYARHKWPHDAAISDIGTGKTRLESAWDLGLRDIDVGPKLPIDDGINAVRMLFPRLFFDGNKCEKLIDALKSYRKEWDEKNRVFKNKPVHDWSSHPADMVRNLAISQIDPMSERDLRNLKSQADIKYDLFNRGFDPWQTETADMTYDLFRQTNPNDQVAQRFWRNKWFGG
jgi:hypothetical protein